MRVTLYTKDECGLCRQAEQMLHGLRREFPFELELVDVDRDPELYDRYRDRVPVIVLDGKEEEAAPLDESHLRTLLARG